MAPAWRNFKNIFFTICTWPNRPVGAKFLSGFQFEGKTDVWISQARHVNVGWIVKRTQYLLIFGTFSFGGRGGQGCYFWANQRVVGKNSAIQNSQITFKPKLACIFLHARTKWSIKVCVGTPCTLHYENKFTKFLSFGFN